MAKIKHIYETSPFYGKILPGDDLIKINGRCVHDLLDYMFFTQTEDGKIELTVRRGDEELCFSSVCEDGDLRIEFEQYLLDKERSCKNKCVFCFIDQMPKNMRKTLYFKDDDFLPVFVIWQLCDDDKCFGRGITADSGFACFAVEYLYPYYQPAVTGSDDA